MNFFQIESKKTKNKINNFKIKKHLITNGETN